MSHKEETFAFEQEELSAEESALLAQMLKGDFSGQLKEPEIPRREVFSPVPLSFGQRRLWILDQLVPGSAFYNIPLVYRLEGEFDTSAFERSINEIVRRHESLRTIFGTENEEPVQVILPEMKIDVPIISLEHLSGLEQEEEILRLASKEAVKPFDLSKGPLMRVTLLRLGPQHHVLLYTTHHIASDTWSTENFIQELVTLYSGFLSGKLSPLEKLRVQYPDFALWQQQRMQGELLEKQFSYWREMLGTDIPILELPADRQRPAVQTYSGDTQSFVLEESLYEKVIALAFRMECSLFMFLLAALNVLFYRYCGQEDILVGSPIANRTRKEIEGLIGYFSNTLVFRTDLSGNPSFRQLLERVRKVTSEAYDNQDIPFEKLVEEFQPERYMSLTPLFQVMLVLQNVPKQQVNLPGQGFSISSISVHNKTCKFDLWISITQLGKILSGVIEYNSDIFIAFTIKRLINHFEILLKGIVQEPDGRINDFPILSPEERKQLLMDWNNTEKEYSIRCIHHMFDEQVEKTPEHLALKGNGQLSIVNCQLSTEKEPFGRILNAFGGMHLTYRELNEKSGQLACLLRAKGVQEDTIVGIMAERSIEMVIGLLGILKAGGAYLPLDPEYPEERIHYILKDSGAEILLKDNDFTPEAFTTCPKGTSSFGIWNLEFGISPRGGQLAYVIYTSGSTGRPKGVMISHAGICNRLLWMQETYRLTPDDRVLQKTPFGFDVSVWEFFLPLLNGAGLVMAVPGGHKDSAYLVEVISKEKITTMHFVPSMLNVFLEEPEISQIRSLKRVICSGEALPFEYLERFFAYFDGHSGVELHNLYGPTEASVDVTSWPCNRGLSRKVIPIGRPIANTQIYILDRNSNLVPIGVPGELHIGGIQLARGYLNNPELTNDKFLIINYKLKTVNKSFCGGSRGAVFSKRAPLVAEGNKIYRTGDLARWLSDGTIEFLGRLDFQVKVRGFRIELGEIESTLRKHDALQDAVVLAREESQGAAGKKLVAYVVPDSQHWHPDQDKETAKIDLSDEQVTDWQGVFDDTYTKDPGEQDPTFNIIGWNSSYTGEPIPAQEMQLWVDHTVERILSLKPEKVMEIGCGTGLFLFRIIPHCRRYLGTDIAQEGLNYIRQQLDQKTVGQDKEKWAELELIQRSADNFDGIDEDEFDLVILNSVVQYFPSADYLVKVLKGAAERVKPGGHIFIGDVRSLLLLKTLHASVEFFQADPDATREQVLGRVMNKMSLEQELVIHPGFFFALKNQVPKIKHVELLLKYGRYCNELSKFRYDAILHINTGNEDYLEIQPDMVLDWKQEKPGIPEIGQRLKEMAKDPGVIVVTSVPDGRAAEDIQVLKWLSEANESTNVGEYRQLLAEGKVKEIGIDPNDFLELARDLPFHIAVTLSWFPGLEGSKEAEGVEGTYNVVFRHQNFKMETRAAIRVYDPSNKPVDIHPWDTYTNNPLLMKISGKLVPELREFLKERLPEYMMPSHFILLDRLPLTSNGKLDRKTLFLHEPIQLTAASAEQENQFVEPHTQTEKLFAEIWESVLFLDKIGINNNFFQLGGDSINAIQVISRANKQGFNLTIRDLYQNLTIAELAQCAEKSQAHVPGEESGGFLLEIDIEEVLRNLPPDVEVETIHPLTPFQKHMLSHYLRDPARENEPGLFMTYRAGRLPYEHLEISLLETAFEKVTEIYPYLRTAFMWEKVKEPVQVVYKKGKPCLHYHDWSSLSADEQEKQLEKYIEEDCSQGFDRDKPEVYRISIIKMSEGDYGYVLTADYMRVDGWSTTLVLNTFVSYCFALASGDTLDLEEDYSDSNYRDFHGWLRWQDAFKGQHFWSGMLEDCRFPTPLAAEVPGNIPGKDRGFARQHRYLSEAETAELESLIKQNQMVLSTLGWAAWAMLLNHYTSEDNVIFGILVSGRSSAQAFVETMVGQTLNVLPVKVNVSPEKPLWDWLREIWEIQVELSQYEYTPQDKVREWWNVPPEKHLFESYLVVMNFPGIRQGMKESQQSTRTVHDYIAQLEYPLRVDLYPGPALCLIMHYYRRYFNDAAVKKMLDDFYTLINEIPKNLHRTTKELMDTIRNQ
ncbi:MAG: amino acid adenylation domain-containing protein [Candidatus Aminicenantes bacterium]|nr:MAG: amino acid adenylation domain-containing protein [Candidatus Aminicenantes bacterium]